MSLPANARRFFAALLALAAPALAHAEPVSLYAAASLSSALRELLPAERFPELRLSFAGSSALAKQIEAGAPADIYFPPNAQWMDYLQQRDLIEAATRTDLLGNALVVVATSDQRAGILLRSDFDFAAAFTGRLALADPDHVPAGIYAKEALQRLGWWDALKVRLAPAPDVRAALTYVARGECTFGIVYATDAAIEKRVATIATFPDSLHAPIRYPVAIVAGRDAPPAHRIFDYLHSAEALALFRRHGFTTHSDEAQRAQP